MMFSPFPIQFVKTGLPGKLAIMGNLHFLNENLSFFNISMLSWPKVFEELRPLLDFSNATLVTGNLPNSCALVAFQVAISISCCQAPQ